MSEKPASRATRSPNYPAIDLKEAIEHIGRIYQTQRQYDASREVLARLLGYKGLNGASTTVVSALSKYGLVEGYGDKLRVSDLGRDLALHLPGDPEYTEAVRAASMRPKFFHDLQEQYPHGLPSDHSLRASLIKNGFNDKAIPGAVRAYQDTLSFVNEVIGSLTEGKKAEDRDLGRKRVDTEALGPDDDDDFPDQSTFAIPVSKGQSATIRARFPLTETEWRQMLSVLNAMKPALVDDSSTDQSAADS